MRPGGMPAESFARGRHRWDPEASRAEMPKNGSERWRGASARGAARAVGARRERGVPVGSRACDRRRARDERCFHGRCCAPASLGSGRAPAVVVAFQLGYFPSASWQSWNFQRRTFNEVTTLTCRRSSPPPNMFKTASELVSGDADAPEDNTDSDTLVDPAHYRDASPLLQGLLFFEGRAVFPQVLSKLHELDPIGVSMLSRSCRACKQAIDNDQAFGWTTGSGL